MSSQGKKKKKIHMAAKRNRIKRFAPVNDRDWNSCSGTMGDATRASAKEKINKHAAPTSNGPKTNGFLQPRGADSMRAKTKPPKPMVITAAPNPSTRFAAVLRLSGTCSMKSRSRRQRGEG